MDESTRLRRALAQQRGWRRQLLVFQLAWLRFYHDGCMHRAAAISYSTVLSAVPLVAVGLMFVAYFGELDTFGQSVQSRIIEFAFPFSGEAAIGPTRAVPGGLLDATAEIETSTGTLLAGANNKQVAQQLRERTEDRLAVIINEKLREFVGNARNLGVLGGLFFIVFAMMLVVAVEEAFNAVWRAARRSWYSRVLNYWAMLTLAPLFLMASLALTSRLTSRAPASVTVVLPILVSFLGFWILFAVMPAVRVSLRSAAMGALITTVLWEAAKQAFAWYLGTYTGLKNIYASLFVVPLVLTWVYYTWLVILFGVEFSCVVHHAVSPGQPLETADGDGLSVDRETLEEMRRMRDRIDEILSRQTNSPDPIVDKRNS